MEKKRSRSFGSDGPVQDKDNGYKQKLVAMNLFNFGLFKSIKNERGSIGENIVIEPKRGWQIINIRELIEYRELFGFLVWRNIKVLYAQTILGMFWAILQPMVQIALFTIVFGKVAKVPTDNIPYLLFASVGIIPWTYMSQGITQSSESLVSSQGMLGKIYFPRLIFPIVPALAKLVDFGISLILLVAIGIYYNVYPTWNLIWFPVFLMMMMAVTAGIGMWLSTLAIRYRDVKYAMGFVIRMLMYTAPIVYSSSSINETYRLWYSFNPVVGVIEGFRASLLGLPIPWIYICPGMLTTLILFVSAAYYFKRMERIVVDVI
jgi:lipopolysaccharide transport system permease protein